MTDWRDVARCTGLANRDYAHYDPWFPAAGEKSPPQVRTLCGGCPGQIGCLAFVMDYERGKSSSARHRYWAGLTPEQRERLDPISPYNRRRVRT